MGDCFIVRRGGGMGKIPTGIEVTTPPTKTSYKAGEKINLAGMVVKANFSDGSSQDITSQCAFSPSAGTTVYEDTTKINVTWVWGKANITYQTSQAITVTRVLSSIAITTQPTKRNYTKGETLNLRYGRKSDLQFRKFRRSDKLHDKPGKWKRAKHNRRHHSHGKLHRKRRDQDNKHNSNSIG